MKKVEGKFSNYPLYTFFVYGVGSECFCYVNKLNLVILKTLENTYDSDYDNEDYNTSNYRVVGFIPKEYFK